MLFWILSILGCGSEPIEKLPDTGMDTGVDEDTNVSEPGSEDTGTDQDGDGFTIEDGDCDDTDPWTNPARDEESNDGIDNDCDGRVDEKWAGVTVSLQNSAGPSSLLTLNQIGNVDNQLQLNNDCIPTYLDHQLDGGWVISHANTALALVDETGNCSVLADFSEEDNTELLGVSAMSDGSFVASRGNSLIQITTDGTITTLAEWDANPMTEAGDANPNFQLYVWSVARNLVSNEIALFGLFGGFATWSQSNGLQIHRQVQVDNWDGRYAYAGAAKDGGGWYTLLYNSDNGEISVARFNFEQSAWVTRIVWSEADQSAQEFAFPNGITVNGDNGDYYVTADVASFSTVFRIREVDEFIDDLYLSSSQPSWTFGGIISNY